MGERNHPEPEGGPGTAEQDRRRGTARYSVPEAARALGISERAVRKRIAAGTLDAEKDGPAWAVFLPSGTRTEPEAVPGGTVAPGAVPAAPGAAAPGGTDLQPLADLIADLTGQVRQLSEAATVWQVRAMQAEERLKALGAGDRPAETLPESGRVSDAPQASPTAPGATAPEPPSWWGRLLRRLGG